MNLKNIIATSLILITVSLIAYKKFYEIDLVDNDDLVILNIEKPEEDIIALVKPVSNLISEPVDKIKNAIFNQEFATRVLNYDTDNQKINDLYVLAAKNFFKDNMVNKYKDLDISLKDVFEAIISSDNHQLTEAEKVKLSKTFSGLAWVLIQK